MVAILINIVLFIIAVWVVISALLVPFLYQISQQALVKQELWEREYNRVVEEHKRARAEWLKTRYGKDE